MGNIIWDKLSQKKQTELTKKIEKLSREFSRIDYTKPAHTNLITNLSFLSVVKCKSPYIKLIPNTSTANIGQSKAGWTKSDRTNARLKNLP